MTSMKKDCDCIKCQLAVKPSWLIMQHALRQNLIYHRIMWAVRYNDSVLKINDEVSKIN